MSRARVGLWPSAPLIVLLVLLSPVLETERVGLRSAGVALAQATAYEGFGASTPGGSGGAVVAVTNLNDSGPGSFREAVAQGQRTVVFEVGGTIELSNAVHVTGAFITIDGFTAPSPGITLHGGGLVIRGSQGAHDLIVRGLRVRGAPGDGVQIAFEAHHIVVDHLSIQGSGDGNLDVTEGAHDVTVAWSILAAPASGKNMLIKYGASRISLHHNLFLDAETRNPQVATDDVGTPATVTTADIWNNVVGQWGDGYGTRIHPAAWVNAANNLYSSPAGDSRQALRVCPANCADDPVTGTAGRLYASGNFSADRLRFEVNDFGTEEGPFAAPPATVEDTCLAARRVVDSSGVRPLDPLDQQAVATVVLPACPAMFMESLYYHALRRDPLEGEVQAWLDGIGPTPPAFLVGAVIQFFFASLEFRTVPVTPSGYATALLRVALGRDPNGDELAYYSGEVGARYNSLIPLFVESGEFAAMRARTTPEDFVSRVVRVVLGRHATPAEIEWGVAYLATTDDISPALITAFGSSEFTRDSRTFGRYVTLVYRALLGRDPNDADQAAWVDFLVGQLATIGARPAEAQQFEARAAALFAPR